MLQLCYKNSKNLVFSSFQKSKTLVLKGLWGLKMVN